MPFSELALNTGVQAVADDVASISLHTADPGADGTANEVTGGTPAYARQSITGANLDTVSGGEITLATDIEFDGPDNGDCPWVGLWTAGDAWLGGFEIIGDGEFSADGKFILKAGDTLFRAKNPTV